MASRSAANTRSCSISTSSGSTAAGSMTTDWNSMPPVTVIRTAPPPDWPSTTCSAALACASSSCSCIFCACLSRSFMSGCLGIGRLLLHHLGAFERLHHVVEGRGYPCDRRARLRARAGRGGLFGDDETQPDRSAEMRLQDSLDLDTLALAAVAVHRIRQGIDRGVPVDIDEPSGLVQRPRASREVRQHVVAPREGEVVAAGHRRV